MNYENKIVCPHCGTLVINEWLESDVYEVTNDPYEDEYRGVQIKYAECVSCNSFTVRLLKGLFRDVGPVNIRPCALEVDTFIYPVVKEGAVSEFIPDELAYDYNEAIKVLPISPKSSAALTRRILQMILRDYYGIKKGNLDKEISEFIIKPDIPSHLTNAVDAIRSVGNFAAHATKIKNTGEIVDVEPGEAEWLIEVIDALFDFTFIQPKKLEERREKLNRKLESIGKPKLKSGS